MSIIEVKDLQKTFNVKQKEKGLKGSFKSVIKPKYVKVNAVQNILQLKHIHNSIISIPPSTLITAGAVHISFLSVSLYGNAFREFQSDEATSHALHD